MTTNASRPEGPRWSVFLPPEGSTKDPPAAQASNGLPDTAILSFNDMNDAHEDLYTRTCHASDVARHARDEAGQLNGEAKRALGTWRTIQLEHPERRAWLPAMTLIALCLLALDSWAAYFAAEALGGDQRVTLLWAALFLVILGLLEAGLAWSAERHKKLFRLIGAGLVGFAVLLALLRFDFFAAVGTSSVAATLGATVFTVCTVMFVAGGFAAIRYAETIGIWRARRQARTAAAAAAAAEASAARRAAERDRRIDAYLARMRPTLLGHPSGVQDIENKVRAHLLRESS